MKSLVLLFAGSFFAGICQGNPEEQTEASSAQILRETYLAFFYDPDYYDKWKFEEAVKKVRVIDSESPFPEMIQLLMEYVEGNYPRALFQLSEAERKLGDSRKYDLDANGSKTLPFSMGAHISYRKFQILSKIGRRGAACEERKNFIKEKRFDLSLIHI